MVIGELGKNGPLALLHATEEQDAVPVSAMHQYQLMVAVNVLEIKKWMEHATPRHVQVSGIHLTLILSLALQRVTNDS